ncbi:MAG: hypothetical protein FWE80_02760 [Oscillospiraceae bacterium]|nr:hypothetical protein [Oscillospiraceae bacterium]
MKHAMDKKFNLRKFLIILLVVITVGAVATTLFVLLKNSDDPDAIPEFAPQDTDNNAEAIEDDDDEEKLEASEGGGAVSMSYSKEVSISLSEKKASIIFWNPKRSTMDAVLQLIVISGEQEAVIAQSQLLPAGYKLEKMDLLDTAKLSAGKYSGKFNILYYNPETGERAVVNTNIPVDIQVKE